MNFLTKTWTPILISILVFQGSFLLYDIKLKNKYILLLVFLCLLILLFLFSINDQNKLIKKNNVIIENGKIFAYIIIISSIIEYFKFGVPVFGDILYVDFGYSYFHHIVVSSWVLAYVAYNENNKFIKLIFIIFSIINPLLMLNRDLMLLTFISLMVMVSNKKLISIKNILIMVLIITIIFGIMGEIRSPNAINSISLPFVFEINELSNFILWPLVYVTSSSFNMLNNFDHLGSDLFNENINVFPEAYHWILLSGKYINALTFYFLCIITLRVIQILSVISNHFYPLYIYLIYQTYMSAFSVKFFTTNTLFTCAVFILLYIFSCSYKKNAKINR